MEFKYDLLSDSVLIEESDYGFEFIEASEWEQDHKYQSREVIFKYDGKFYRIFEMRSGSPFTDWHYEDMDVDSNGMVDCDEVFKVKKVVEIWSSYPSG